MKTKAGTTVFPLKDLNKLWVFKKHNKKLKLI